MVRYQPEDLYSLPIPAVQCIAVLVLALLLPVLATDVLLKKSHLERSKESVS